MATAQRHRNRSRLSVCITRGIDDGPAAVRGDAELVENGYCGQALTVRAVRPDPSKNTGGLLFDSADRVLIAGIDPRRTGTSPDGRAAVYARLREAVAAVPGIEAASGTAITPVSNSAAARRMMDDLSSAH